VRGIDKSSHRGGLTERDPAHDGGRRPLEAQPPEVRPQWDPDRLGEHVHKPAGRKSDLDRESLE
jgi:hypothetical protein